MRKTGRAVLTCAWLLAAAALPRLLTWQGPIPHGPPLAALPQELGAFAGAPGTLRPDQDMLAWGTQALYDDALTRRYRHPQGLVFEVQIFYSQARRPRNALTNCLERVNCLHGHYQTRAEEALQLAPGLPAQRLRLARKDLHASVVYWIQAAARTSRNPYRHLLWSYAEDVLRRRTDGCFVKIAYAGPPDPQQDRLQAALCREVHTALQKWLEARTVQR